MDVNPTLEYGYEHRIGAKLHDYEYNDTIDKEDLVPNIHKCIDSLYTTSLDKQRAACNLRRVGGMMSDFKRDTTASAYYGFSMTSYILKFPLKNVFFFNKTFVTRLNRHSGGYPRKINGNVVVNPNSAKHKKFISISDVQMTPTGSGTKAERVIHKKGGIAPPTIDNYHITFNISDTANRPDVFSHRLLFFVDGKLFTDLQMYIVENYVIMVIDAERLGMTIAQADTYTNPLYDYRWTLIGMPFGNFYKTPDDGGNVEYLWYGDSLAEDAAKARMPICTWNDIQTYRLVNNKKVPAPKSTDTSKYTMATGLNSIAQYKEPSGMYLVGHAYQVENTKVNNKVYRQKTAMMTMSINPIIKTSAIETVNNGDGTYTDNASYEYAVKCYNNSVSYSNLGNTSKVKFATTTKKDIHIMELNNIASVIELGTNRIFQVGCSGNIPGPIPPENILIFKVDSTDGLSLVHMTSSTYRNNDGSNEYDELARNVQKPLKASLAFKRKNRDIYDDPKFIPTRDEYHPGEDVHGEYEVNEYTDTVIGGYTYTTTETVNKQIDTVREQQKYIDLYYPNVYHLVNFDSTDNLIAVIFYDVSCENTFVNPLESYMTYDVSYANNIVAGNLPKAIKEYIPEISRYTEDNYLNTYHTKATRAIEHQFKLEALRELVNDDSSRLTGIYNRRYNKVNNEIHANVKYLIDLTKDSDDSSIDRSSQTIKHIYRDQLIVDYSTEELKSALYVKVFKNGGIFDLHRIDGITLFKTINGNLVLDMWSTDADGVPYDNTYTDRYVQVTYDEHTYTINVPYERIYGERAFAYSFHLHHKENMLFPVSVWADGKRISNNDYNVTSSTFMSKISISSNAVLNSKYISIEMYKIKNTNSMYKTITLPDIHNSISIKSNINETLWDDISPQNIMVAVQKNTLSDDLENNPVYETRYLVPSNYEMYWLLFGNIQYVNGIPVNIELDDGVARTYMYNVIKSMQAKYVDSSGNVHTEKETALLIDDNTALIGETSETMNGDVSILKTFGDKQYFKVFSDSEELYQYFIANADLYQEICQKLRNNGLTNSQKTRYDYLVELENPTEEEATELAEYQAIISDYMTNGLSAHDREVYDIYREIENSMDISDADRREYVVMLREGFYGRDRKRFYDYLPMGSKDPMVYITPITSFFANQTVMIKNTDVYLSKTFTITPSIYAEKNRTFVYEEFGLDPSPQKYRVFLDGVLLDYDYDYINDVNLENQNFYTDSDITFIIRKDIDDTRMHFITFEYLPFKYGLVYRGREHDGIVMLADEYIRPFDLRHYDVYVDGILMNEDQIEIITERRIAIKPIVNAIGTENEFHPIVSIYERQHDADVFDYVWRNHKASFTYVDHTNPVVNNDDNVKRYPNNPNEYIDVKMAQMIKHSLDEQLIRDDPAYRKFRTPSYDPQRSSSEGVITNLG